MSTSAIGLQREHSPAKSADRTALDRLAEHCGIQSSSEQDASGNDHVTTPELKRALLHAMHLPAETENQAAETLADLNAREWQRTTPPVVVAYASAGPAAVSLHLPADTREVSWTLRLEDGSHHEGVDEVRYLPLLAERHPIPNERPALFTERQHNGTSLQRRALTLPHPLPWGYHTLSVAGSPDRTTLIVTPGTCWLPTEDGETRLWGLDAKLFLLRSCSNWGIGDFTDLRDLVHLARTHGAEVVGLNPLHAMFLDQPEDASPYSPSDRTLLNVLFIDVQAIPELASSEAAQALIASPEFQRDLESVRASGLVQYGQVATLKLQALRLLFQAFQERNDPARAQELAAFVEERGPAFHRACTFRALREHFVAQDPALADSASWPEQYRRSDSPAVEVFAREHSHAVRFHLWLQWIADTQLLMAAAAADGMAIGLYRDLAVGAHPSGAEIWSHPEELVADAQVGAPPDALGPAGQNWGLPPLHPIAAREHAYSSFIGLLRANMRYAGGLRIDHAMALKRLYWIPKGGDARHGAYVHYQMEEMIGILALESHRHRCLIVGEDLGTVPEGFRDRMAQARILSYRVLFFEQQDKQFLSPQQYPYLALSVASNHDLPTLAGWWQGADIDLKESLGLLPDGSAAMRAEREEDRASLLALLEHLGFLQNAGPVQGSEFSIAAHAFLARSRTLLTLVQLDDLTEEVNQVNMPGTSSENPNWRRRLSLTLDRIASGARLQQVAALMSERRDS